MSKDVQKLVIENNELAGRIGRLHDFLATDEGKKLPPLEFDLMVTQANAMLAYASALSIRIKLSQSSPDVAKSVTLVS